jgi:hypothetical protein
MRIITAVAFSTAVLFSPLFAAAQNAPAPAAATATAAPTTAAAPAATATATAAPMAAASPGAAMPAPAATAAAADSSAVNLDEVVCRTVAAPTGSRLGGGRECHTVRQWNQRERESQDLTRQQERIGFAVPGG